MVELMTALSLYCANTYAGYAGNIRKCQARVMECDALSILRKGASPAPVEYLEVYVTCAREAGRK